MFVLPPSGPDADLRRGLHFQARRCRALADDLDAIADGGYPDGATLSAAPVLDEPRLAPIALPVLTGAVTGHPLLPGVERRIATSLVEIISPQAHWARTQSRFYRLGEAPIGFRPLQLHPFRRAAVMTSDDIGALLDEVLAETDHVESGEFRGIVDRRSQTTAAQRNSSSGLNGGSAATAQGRTTSGKAGARATMHMPWQRPRFPSAAFAASRGGRIGHFLFGCMLRRSLRPVVDLWLDRPSLVRLDLPEGCSTEQVAKALRKLMIPLDQLTEEHANINHIGQTHVIEIEKEERVKSVEAARRRQVAAMMPDLQDRGTLSRRIFLIVEHGADLAPEISDLCDHQLALSPPHRRHIAAACHRMLGFPPDDAMLDQMSAVPIGEIDLVLRPGTGREQLRSILAARAKREAAPSKADVAWTVSLDTLPGMADATAWGLELARDLHDWRDGLIGWQDVDRGVLLHGSPGTGKTTFARALAASCQVPLIATSVVQWQATGHLGDLLGAMRRSFAEARDKAPSILFVDELGLHRRACRVRRRSPELRTTGREWPARMPGRRGRAARASSSSGRAMIPPTSTLPCSGPGASTG